MRDALDVEADQAGGDRIAADGDQAKAEGGLAKDDLGGDAQRRGKAW